MLGEVILKIFQTIHSPTPAPSQINLVNRKLAIEVGYKSLSASSTCIYELHNVARV